MASKRKTAAKKSASRSKQPQIIRLKEFLQNFHDTHEFDPERSFCFILGSGASLTADIPTGAQLVDRWLVEMHDADDACTLRILPPHATIETFAGSLLPGETERLKKWSEEKFSHIRGFSFEERAAHYGRIYKARFQSEPALGQLFLRKLIHRRPPSIGFHLLARILNRTRHRIVITTNFDHLVEDAIAITENEAIQSYNHEHLASFLRGNAGHPAIAKIHGDILLHTFNADEELEDLSASWKSTLRSLFQTHTPIVIGYGGNDPGFMDFLIEEMKGWPEERRCYWFVRKQDSFAKVRKCGELAGIKSLRLVECPGFTELMVLLDEIFNFKPLDEELQEQAKKIAGALKSSAAKARGEVENHQRRLLESSMAGTISDSGDGSGYSVAADLPPPAARTLGDWRDAIVNSPNLAIEEETISEALAALPDSLALQALVASRSLQREPTDRSTLREIEKLLKQSESRSGPQSEETLQVMHSLAVAWHLVGEYSQAEALGQRVISERMRVLGPEHPATLSSRMNLGNALHAQGKNAEAEREHRAVLAIREHVLGSEHPDTLMSCINLSRTLEVLGREGEALEFAKRALEGWNKVLGEDHRKSQAAKQRVKRLESK